MLSSFKGKGPERDSEAIIPVPVPPRMPVAAKAPAPTAAPASRSETISSIGPDMTIVGSIVCEGRAHILGRVEGELGAVELLIGEGAQVAGNVVAQELTVCGHVKGTIRAVRVKLKGTAVVEGDIFHRSLSIEENALFEGSSRRVENPIETTPAPSASAPSASAPSAQMPSAQAQAPAAAQMSNAPLNGQHQPVQPGPQALQAYVQHELASVDLDPSTM